MSHHQTRSCKTKMFMCFSLFLCVVVVGAWAPLLAQSPPPRFAYVANQNSGNVSAYTINATTGALMPVPGSPFPAGWRPTSVTVDPTGQFAYVVNAACGGGCEGSVSAYTINGTTGALTPVAGSPFPTGEGATSGTVDPTGQFAYVTNSYSNNVSGYAINGITGALTPVPGSPFPVGLIPHSVAVDPTGQFAYVTHIVRSGPYAYSGRVSAYIINPKTGALMLVGSWTTYPSDQNPLWGWVAVDPTGQFVYVAVISGRVWAYTINPKTGALTAVPGSPFSAGAHPSSVTVDPTGQFAYVANEWSGNVSAYTINATTGALTAIPGSPFPTGTYPYSVTVDPTGQFAYVANQTGCGGCEGSVWAYTINSTTGALTLIPGPPFPTRVQPRSVTTTAGPRFADLVALDCNLESTLRSVESVTAISVQFLNATAEVRKVYELDLAGERVLRVPSLAPGIANVQATFLTHPWVVTDVDDQCVTIYRPAIVRAVIRQ